MRQDALYSVAELCGFFEVSRSGFYAHINKNSGPRRLQDRQIAQVIVKTFHDNLSNYGTPRLRQELQLKGMHHGRRRIGRLMRQEGLCAVAKSSWTPRTTDSSHGRAVAPRLFQDEVPTSRPDQVWVTDITYIPTKEGWLFLSAQMDRYSRRILGWATAENMATPLIIKSLERAVTTRSKPLPDLLQHSDQGSQYASDLYIQLLQDLNITQSMSRRGNCYDNAAMESFWSTLKTECFGRFIPTTRTEAKSMIFDYIETFYNPVRRHSSLGYKSPVDFEKNHTQN
jgi:putative transposase